jgi:hypothetical protein
VFEWLKGKSKRPSDYELISRVASLIDAFIDQQGLEEFSLNRLFVVVGPDYRVWISDDPKTGLASVPLPDLKIEPAVVMAGGDMRHVHIDFTARNVVDRIPR